MELECFPLARKIKLDVPRINPEKEINNPLTNSNGFIEVKKNNATIVSMEANAAIVKN